MRLSFMFLIFAIVLSGCAGSGNHPDNKILAQVGQRELKRQEVASSIPYGLASSDSLLMAEHLVKRWVKDQLVYEVALRNIDDKEAIDHLVEEYRKALVRNRYQERLVNEKVSLEVSESEKRAYYDANQDKFALNKCLIKGLFLKVPVDAPGLSDLKKWYRSTDEDDLERIEKYSVQNAAIYEFFYDKWVNFARCGLIIPITGFAHSMQSAALDYRREGFVTGLGSNMLKLAGSVIIYGIISAYIFGIVRFLIFGGNV